MPEPLAETLRRLHREATPGPWSGHVTGIRVPSLGHPFSSHDRCVGTADPPDVAVIVTLRNALPALADLVAWCEKRVHDPCHWQPMHDPGGEPETCVPCGAGRALAALVEVLGAKHA